MKFYLDTNIVLDLLLRREPHLQAASAIFNYSSLEKVSLYTSSHCIATVHYIAKKTFKEEPLRLLIDEILDFFEIIPVDIDILRKSLKSSHRDFEDAIQILSAHKVKNLDGIITRNVKDFSTSEITVFSPDQAINYITKKLKK